MRRLTQLVACAALTCGFAAVSVAGASAETLPEIMQCGHARRQSKAEGGKYLGHYVGKKCEPSEKATKAEEEEGKKNKYELEPWNLGSKTEKTGKEGKVKAFKGKSKGANLEAEGIGGVSCTSSGDVGDFTGPKTAADIVVTFKGCEFNGRKCASAGEALGTIVTFPLKGEVGYLEGKGTGSPKVGVLITPESGTLLAKWACKEEDLAASGGVIGEISSPINAFTKEAVFLFKQKRIGVNAWQKFEEQPEVQLLAGLCEECSEPMEPKSGGVQAPASQEIESVNKGEELMLKA